MRMAHRVLMNLPHCIVPRLLESREDIESSVVIDASDLYPSWKQWMSMGSIGQRARRDGVSIEERFQQIGDISTPYASLFIEYEVLGHAIGCWVRRLITNSGNRIAFVGFRAVNGVAGRISGSLVVDATDRGMYQSYEYVPTPDDPADRERVILSLFNPTMFGMWAISMLNCRRQTSLVERPDFNPPDKWLRRQKQPRLRYHTLNIDPLKKMLKYDEKADPTGQQLAWHLCRGHWKHYTEEKPLFGRYVGSVWCPPHAKGNRENGVVLKDYAIKIADE